MTTPQELDQQANALREQAAAMARQAQALRDAQRGEKVAEIKALMAQYGVTGADLGFSGKGASGRRNAHPSKGKTVAAKFSDGTNTWSGRGLKPKWLSNAIAGGKSLSDFAV